MIPLITRDIATQCVGAGWAVLVNNCFDICDQAGIPYQVDQVKEKFGGLRFYVTFQRPEALGLLEANPPESQERVMRALEAISLQEGRSLETCEECGAPGYPSSGAGRWIKTLCAPHREERDARNQVSNQPTSGAVSAMAKKHPELPHTEATILTPEELAATWKSAYEQADDLGLSYDRVYVTGTGVVLLYLHERTEECIAYGCVIHNPTDPHTEFPTHWRWDRKFMERICPHGVGHPDTNQINFIRRTRGEAAAQAESVHGCDGCCAPSPTRVV